MLLGLADMCHEIPKGDVSKFPTEVDVIVGPGVKETFLPGYPTRKDSPLLESDFKYASSYCFVLFPSVSFVCYSARD